MSRPGDESGAALVEFAMIIPVFLLLFYGLITFGVTLAQKQNITNAAADAARAAVGAPDLTTAENTATNRVRQALGTTAAYRISFNLTTDADYDPTIQASGACGTNNCITVRIIYDRPLFPGLSLPGLRTLGPPAIKSTAVVQYS
jgi:Flp pilus assembly protein TadG